jgi:hypothetical protein
MRGTSPAPGPLRDAFDLASGALSERLSDRPLHTDVAAAAALLAAGPGDRSGTYLADLMPGEVDIF